MFSSEKRLVHAIFKDLDSKHWYRYFFPRGFYALAGRLIPWFAVAATAACVAGLYLGLFVVTVDASQGEVARIVFIHLPASWASLLICLAMTASAAIGLAPNARLAAMVAQSLAPTGLLFAFLGLWTGCMWTKPIWGIWWTWNPRTFSQLVLAFLFIGFIGLHSAIEDSERANKAGASLALAGMLGISAYLAAVQSWPVQYLGTSPGVLGAGGMTSLLAVSLGFLMYAGAAALLRLRCVILESERQCDWVTQGGSSAP